MPISLSSIVTLLQLSFLSHPSIHRLNYKQQLQNQMLFSCILIGISIYGILAETNQSVHISIISLNIISLVLQCKTKSVSLYSHYFRDLLWLLIIIHWLKFNNVSILSALLIQFTHLCPTILAIQAIGILIWIICVINSELTNSMMIEVVIISLVILIVQFKQSFSRLEIEIHQNELKSRLDMNEAILKWICENIECKIMLIKQYQEENQDSDNHRIYYLVNESVANLNPSILNSMKFSEYRGKTYGQGNSDDLPLKPILEEYNYYLKSPLFNNSYQYQSQLNIQSNVVKINGSKILIMFNKPISQCQVEAALIASLNHKLKTHLSAGIVYLTAANQDTSVNTNIKQQFIFPALQNCRMQLYQVQDVLDYLTLDKEVMYAQRKQDNLISITLEVMLFISPQCHEKSIELNLIVNDKKFDQLNTEPLFFFTDENKLHRILLNLLNNSYRHTMNGGIITIEINSNNSSAQFSISDTGSGICEQQIVKLNRIFLQQVDCKEQIYLTENMIGIGLIITNKMAMTLNLHSKPLQLQNCQVGGLKAMFLIENIQNLKGSVHSKSVQLIENYRSQTLWNNQTPRLFHSIFTTRKNVLDTSFKIDDEPKIDQLATSNRKRIFKSKKVIDEEQIPIISKQEICMQDIEQYKNGIQANIISTHSQIIPPDIKSNQIINLKARPSITIKPSSYIQGLYNANKLDSNRSIQLGVISQNQFEYDHLKEGKIIIVDDEPFNHTSLALMLQTLHSSEIIDLYDGKEFINYITSHPISIRAVLMDVDMPIMDGIVATKIAIQMQEHSQISLFPIIGCTAHQDQFTQEQCLNAGMVAVLTKPVFKKSLIDVLKFIEGSIESNLIQMNSIGSNEF